jgi:predicted ferric reductase
MFWYLSRALGVVAYVALTLEVVLGLSASTGQLDRALGRARVIELHSWLSAVALGTLGGHAVVLLGDQTVKLSVLQVLVPFTTEYRPFAVGLGVVSAYLALVVHGSFWLRKRIGPRTWRKTHYVTFAVFTLATFHGLLAGSDAEAPAMRALFAGATGLVASLTFLRIVLYVARARFRGTERPSPPASAPTRPREAWPTGGGRTAG